MSITRCTICQKQFDSDFEGEVLNDKEVCNYCFEEETNNE